MASNPQLRPAEEPPLGPEAGAIPAAAPAPVAAASPARADGRRAWAGSLATLAAASALLAWAFRIEIAAAVHVWWSSAAYGHAFFIVPISLFLLYRLRHRLAALRPRAAPWALVPVALLSLLWLVGELANLMVVKQLVFVALWQSLFLLVLGWRVTRAALFPLAYLYFAVPFGSSIIPVLQDVTAQMVVHLLRLTGMPVFLDGYLIQIPSGSFLVAEACSGVRYLLVSVALGVLTAYLFFRSWPRRLFFVALSVVVPIVANGIRAYGIVMLAHLSGHEIAVDVDHVVYGFVFLGIVTVILLGLAALLRDRHGPSEPDAPEPAASSRRPARTPLAAQALSAGAAIAVIFLAQGWAAVARQAPAEPAPLPSLPQVAAPWLPATEGAPGWSPRFHGSDVTLQGSYRLGDARVDLHVAYYARQREEAEAISDLNVLLGAGRDWRAQDLTRATVQVAGTSHPYVRMNLIRGNDSYVVWYWYWIDGQRTNSRILGKLLEVKAAMLGGDPAAAMIAIASRVSEDVQRTEALLGTFLNHTLDGDGTLVRLDSSRAPAGTAKAP